MIHDGVFNPAIRILLENRPGVDRYASTVLGPLEWAVSLSRGSDAQGRLSYVISVDLMRRAHAVQCSFVVAHYLRYEREQSVRDARYLAAQYGITLWVQDDTVGWHIDLEGVTHPLDSSNWIV